MRLKGVEASLLEERTKVSGRRKYSGITQANPDKRDSANERQALE